MLDLNKYSSLSYTFNAQTKFRSIVRIENFHFLALPYLVSNITVPSFFLHIPPKRLMVKSMLEGIGNIYWFLEDHAQIQHIKQKHNINIFFN